MEKPLNKNMLLILVLLLLALVVVVAMQYGGGDNLQGYLRFYSTSPPAAL